MPHFDRAEVDPLIFRFSYFGRVTNKLPARILPQTTAGINPEQFSDDLFFARNRKAAAIILAVFLVIGFALRVHNLGAESLGEDELNKLQTVEEYRTNGLSGKNGEHPFLMKGLQTVSIVVAERANDLVSSPVLRISEEAALRFPVALFGTFTTLLIFLLVSELFGRSIGLVSAVLWAIEPAAIGFDRTAKEDSLVLFFFLLAALFWIRSQTAAERGKINWPWYLWGAAASFAALMASKYYPHMLAITGGYYNIFQRIPERKWDIGKIRFLKFFAVMGVAFLALNPTILLPDTWREMLKFSTENRIAHDSYEFMGVLYRNQMTHWLSGVPWTFYYIFIAVKSSATTLILFLVGLPFIFRKRMGDGRFFIFFWAFMWFMPFTILGGKFTRYFTFVEPLILILAAVGFYFSVKWVTEQLFSHPPARTAFQIVCLTSIITVPLWNSVSATPHFRLFTNTIGGGAAAAGSYFPHDEFYDAATRYIIAELSERAQAGSVVACETPALFEHYADKIGRGDLIFVSLSDPIKVDGLRAGDFVVFVKGRRYLSNAAFEEYLDRSAAPFVEIKIAGITAAKLYQLDDTMSAGMRANRKSSR